MAIKNSVLPQVVAFKQDEHSFLLDFPGLRRMVHADGFCRSEFPVRRNPQPSTLNPQPPDLNPPPYTLNPNPETLNSKPWTLSDSRP
jgi:hypothetical protein